MIPIRATATVDPIDGVFEHGYLGSVLGDMIVVGTFPSTSWQQRSYLLQTAKRYIRPWAQFALGDVLVNIQAGYRPRWIDGDEWASVVLAGTGLGELQPGDGSIAPGQAANVPPVPSSLSPELDPYEIPRDGLWRTDLFVPTGNTADYWVQVEAVDPVGPGSIDSDVVTVTARIGSTYLRRYADAAAPIVFAFEVHPALTAGEVLIRAYANDVLVFEHYAPAAAIETTERPQIDVSGAGLWQYNRFDYGVEYSGTYGTTPYTYHLPHMNEESQSNPLRGIGVPNVLDWTRTGDAIVDTQIGRRHGQAAACQYRVTVSGQPTSIRLPSLRATYGPITTPDGLDVIAYEGKLYVRPTGATQWPSAPFEPDGDGQADTVTALGLGTVPTQTPEPTHNPNPSVLYVEPFPSGLSLYDDIPHDAPFVSSGGMGGRIAQGPGGRGSTAGAASIWIDGRGLVDYAGLILRRMPRSPIADVDTLRDQHAVGLRLGGLDVEFGPPTAYDFDARMGIAGVVGYDVGTGAIHFADTEGHAVTVADDVTGGESWPEPWVWRRPDGRWYVGCADGDAFRGWVGDGAGGFTEEGTGGGGRLSSARWARGDTGTEAVFGVQATAGEFNSGALVVYHRHGQGAAWAGPVVLDVISPPTDGTIWQRPDGRWEAIARAVGLDATYAPNSTPYDESGDTWRVWLAGSPAGPWQEAGAA